MSAITAITTMRPAEGWALRAACRDHQDPDLWFPLHDSGREYRHAVRICRGCPVRIDCLHYALSVERGDATIHGVWGGFTAEQRQCLRRCLTGNCHHPSPESCMQAVTP